MVDHLVRKIIVLLLLKLQLLVIVVVEAVIYTRLVDGLLSNWLLPGCNVLLLRHTRVQICTKRELIILLGRGHIHLLPGRVDVHVSKLLLYGVHIYFLVILSCFQFSSLLLYELSKEDAVKVSGGSFLVSSIWLNDAVWVAIGVLYWS